jgi:colicin import membrane protein
MVCGSALFHLLVGLFLLNFHFSSEFREAPVYYVDLLDLPVAHPQAGTPGNRENAPSPAPPAAPPPAAPPHREMTLPVKPSGKDLSKKPSVPPVKPSDSAETARDFEERITRMEREAEARHEASALDALRKRGRAGGPVGMPGASGNEAGSDYASYVESRLKDALKTTIAYQSKSPVVIIQLTIGRNGRFARVRIKQSSGDKLFESAVTRAIATAEKNLRPPPSGEEFSTEVRFHPEENRKN